MEVSSRDKFSNLYIDIIVNHASKLAKLYAKPEKTAVLSAISLFQFICSYGLFDMLMTDPARERLYIRSYGTSNSVVWHGPYVLIGGST